MEKKHGARTASGRGTIRKKTVKRNNKRYTYWESRITIGSDPGTGKQIQRSFSGKTQKEVVQKMAIAQRELADGTYIGPQKISLGEWLDTWLAEYVIPVSKPYTADTYQSRVQIHIKPALGDIKLRSLNTMQLQAFCNSLTSEKHLSSKTVIHIMAVLKRALNQAVEIKYSKLNRRWRIWQSKRIRQNLSRLLSTK